MSNNLYLQLFLTFCKIGAFTFGGGWAMISIIQREIVEKHKWIALDDFLDLLAVAQSMPGILAVNICAAIGTILPSFLMILAIAIFLTPETIKNNAVVSRIFKGIRPAVVALIVAPVLTTARSAGINWKTVIIPVAVALLIYSKLPYISNPIIYIVLGAVGGYIYYMHSLLNKGTEQQQEGHHA